MKRCNFGTMKSSETWILDQNNVHFQNRCVLWEVHMYFVFFLYIYNQLNSLKIEEKIILLLRKWLWTFFVPPLIHIVLQVYCIQKNCLCTISTQQSEFMGLRYLPRSAWNRPTKPNCQYLECLEGYHNHHSHFWWVQILSFFYFLNKWTWFIYRNRFSNKN